MQEATPAASSATCCKPVGAELIRNGLFALPAAAATTTKGTGEKVDFLDRHETATAALLAVTINRPGPARALVVIVTQHGAEKRLIGSALAGHPIIALDNCNGVLSGDFLAQLTERPVLDLRALGSSDKARINNVFTFTLRATTSSFTAT